MNCFLFATHCSNSSASIRFAFSRFTNECNFRRTFLRITALMESTQISVISAVSSRSHSTSSCNNRTYKMGQLSSLFFTAVHSL